MQRRNYGVGNEWRFERCGQTVERPVGHPRVPLLARINRWTPSVAATKIAAATMSGGTTVINSVTL